MQEMFWCLALSYEGYENILDSPTHDECLLMVLLLYMLFDLIFALLKVHCAKLGGHLQSETIQGQLLIDSL